MATERCYIVLFLAALAKRMEPELNRNSMRRTDSIMMFGLKDLLTKFKWQELFAISFSTVIKVDYDVLRHVMHVLFCVNSWNNNKLESDETPVSVSDWMYSIANLYSDMKSDKFWVHGYTDVEVQGLSSYNYDDWANRMIAEAFKVEGLLRKDTAVSEYKCANCGCEDCPGMLKYPKNSEWKREIGCEPDASTYDILDVDDEENEYDLTGVCPSFKPFWFTKDY